MVKLPVIKMNKNAQDPYGDLQNRDLVEFYKSLPHGLLIISLQFPPHSLELTNNSFLFGNFELCKLVPFSTVDMALHPLTKRNLKNAGLAGAIITLCAYTCNWHFIFPFIHFVP